MGDLISRQATIDAINMLPDHLNCYSNIYEKVCVIGVLENLPSAQKKGEWIDLGKDKAIRWQCSECGRKDTHIYNYCPDCGSDNRW